MSVVAAFLAIVFGVFRFLISPIGFFVWGLGALTFILLPALARVTGTKRFANLHVWLAFWILGRAAIVVSEHNDLLLKNMEFDDLGVEKMSFSDTTKKFEDPGAALSHFWGFPFALADEVHGFLFDPRHAAIGDRRHEHKERGEMHYRATDSEYEADTIWGWIRGVFALPSNGYELMDLSKVRRLVTGNERAEYPERVEKIYEISRQPYRESASMRRLLMPIAAFLAVLGGMWFISSQGGGNSGGSTISFGLLSLLAATRLEDTRRLAVAGAAIAVPVLLLVVVYQVLGVILATVFVLIYALGFLALPFLAGIGRAVSTLGGPLSRFILMLGFLGYRRPVFNWTPTGYELREWDDLDHADRTPKWYGFAGGVLGFTFEPGRESWDTEVVDRDVIEAQSEAVTDGGPSTSNVPSGYVRAPSIQRGPYAAFVPASLDDDSYYLDTGIAFSRLRDAALGEKSLRTLLESKEEYGGVSQTIGDKALMYATLGFGGLGAVLGTVIFFL